MRANQGSLTEESREGLEDKINCEPWEGDRVINLKAIVGVQDG